MSGKVQTENYAAHYRIPEQDYQAYYTKANGYSTDQVAGMNKRYRTGAYKGEQPLDGPPNFQAEQPIARPPAFRAEQPIARPPAFAAEQRIPGLPRYTAEQPIRRPPAFRAEQPMPAPRVPNPGSVRVNSLGIFQSGREMSSQTSDISGPVIEYVKRKPPENKIYLGYN